MLKVLVAFIDRRSLFNSVTARLYQSCGVLIYLGALAHDEDSFHA
jgi:hypothetical protein